ncbi:MAG: SAM-dependent methyltransferase [Gammaproteobacteria bacterium]|nr:SAM-dependent methyltransferase [Gammaproteobacteria bacterium]
MRSGPIPLLTERECTALAAARAAGEAQLECTLDLGRSRGFVALAAQDWAWDGRRFPYPGACKPRTIHHWTGAAFEPVARFTHALFKLVPTEWGPPTFAIDGVKMLPTAKLSPYVDAQRKVALIAPRGKVVLDACGGLGYFAAWCLQGGARRILSFEKHADVLWLRSLNPWSPDSAWQAPPGAALELRQGDIAQEIQGLGSASVDAVLHDPPRFALAGELYSQAFYGQLARVLRPGGLLFHYTGAPNSISRGRELAREVCARLGQAGFSTGFNGDGVLARATGARPPRARARVARGTGPRR